MYSKLFRQLVLLYSFTVTLSSCPFNAISPDHEKIINQLNKNEELMFNGKSINVGEEVKKEVFTNYISDFNSGTKWEYETKFNFKNTNIRYEDGEFHNQLNDYMTGRPVNTYVEVIDFNKKDSYLKLKFSNSMTWVSRETETKIDILNKFPSTRNNLNFLFVWILSLTKVGREDSPFGDDFFFGGDVAYFNGAEPSNYEAENIFTKYKYQGKQDVFLNGKKYIGYKISYELRDIIPKSEWILSPADDGLLKAKGKSIFVKGVGVVKDETDISFEYFYRTRTFDDDFKHWLISDPIGQKTHYNVISNLKNLSIK